MDGGNGDWGGARFEAICARVGGLGLGMGAIKCVCVCVCVI